MKCPHCKEDINSVVIVSESYETGYLEGSRTIQSRGSSEEGGIVRVVCPECGGDADVEE